MFWAIYLAVWFAGTAMMVREGLWTGAITLVNILFSGLVAYGFYSPLVIYLDEMTGGSNTYWLDFVVIWALFVVTMLVSRVVTNFASRTRMRFKYPIDPIGGPLVALLAAWVLASFVMATLHTSPMPRDAFGAKLVRADEVQTANALTAPDAAWLRFVERVAHSDAFGPSVETIQQAFEGLSMEGVDRVFGSQEFVRRYGDRREQFANSGAEWLRVPR